jgi:hypothetical protein
MADTLTFDEGNELLEIAPNAAYVAITNTSGELSFELDVGAGATTRYVRVVVIGPVAVTSPDPVTYS